MPRSRFFASLSLALALGLIVSAPLAAYTVYLKDGSTLQAKEKYRVEGDRAYIVLLNGTETFLEASEIDVQRTEEANRANYGSAVVLDGAENRELPNPETLPPRQESSLADLVNRVPRPRAEARREDSPSPSNPRAERTPAGFVDLSTLSRKPFHEIEIATQIQRLFRGQEIDEVQIYRGTREGRPMVEVVTNSEASVFRALAVGAGTLLQLADRYPGQVEALEMLMLTPRHQRAGQFTLTPEMARELIGKKIDITSFFLRYVEF